MKRKDTRHPPIAKAMDVIVGNAEDFSDVDVDVPEATWQSFIRRLVRQFVMSLLFGFTGVPMLWRTSKFYGVFLLVLFCVSLTLTLTLGWWYTFVIVGFLWLVDLVTIGMRMHFYVQGRRTHAKCVEENDSAQ